jgi:hypothetical protein
MSESESQGAECEDCHQTRAIICVAGYADWESALCEDHAHLAEVNTINARVASLESALAAAQLENEAWRALAAWRSNWLGQEVGEFTPSRVGYRVNGVKHSRVGSAVQTGFGETTGAAAVDLARKLNLIAPFGKETT